MIPITSVSFGQKTEELVLEVLRSGMIASGPMVKRFEDGFADICNVEHAVAVSNGTVSLIAALQAAGIGPGSEVITTPFTFVATLNAALHVGATVRFADIEYDTFNLDAQHVAALTSNNTAAIMPVHLFGQPADVASIIANAPQGTVVIEDAAQAHGATLNSTPVGSFGIGSFSFYATKNITTGEGGMVTTNDANIADTVRLLANQGMRARYQYEMPGFNLRLTDLQAAVGISQLDDYANVVSQRQQNAALLSESLGNIEGLVVPTIAPHRTHVWHQYTIRVGSDAPHSRDDVVAALNERGIGAGVYYPKLAWDYDCFSQHPRVMRDETPIAAQAAKEVVSLPVHSRLSPGDLDQIVTNVREVFSA